MFKRISLILVSALLLSSFAVADEKTDIEAVKKVLNKIMPELTVDSVAPSPIPGMFEAVMGTQILYVSKDGRYLIQGDLIDINKRENLSESVRGKQRLKLVNNVNEKDMIVFNPKGQAKHTVTVFTDVDCGYCRKLHREMDQYLERGIRIRYLAFPRTGVDSKSYYKAVSVWCAPDRQKALTEAKNGEEPTKRECKNPVADQFKLGEEFGITGTPTLVLQNGEVIPGYVPADRLEKILKGS